MPQNYLKCLGRKKTFCGQGRTLLMSPGNSQPSTCSTLSWWLVSADGPAFWAAPWDESAGEHKCYRQGREERRILLLLAREAQSNPELSEHRALVLGALLYPAAELCKSGIKLFLRPPVFSQIWTKLVTHLKYNEEGLTLLGQRDLTESMATKVLSALKVRQKENPFWVKIKNLKLVPQIIS